MGRSDHKWKDLEGGLEKMNFYKTASVLKNLERRLHRKVVGRKIMRYCPDLCAQFRYQFFDADSYFLISASIDHELRWTQI